MRKSAVPKLLTCLIVVCGSAPALADMPPPPPPPSLDQIVRTSTVIAVATGIELFQYRRDPATGVATVEKLPENPKEYSGLFVLRARVKNLLYCKTPCPDRPDIYIYLGLNGIQTPKVRQLFDKRTYIFLLFDRPLGTRGVAKQFLDKWRARNGGSIGFYRPLDELAIVRSKIKAIKGRASRP